MHVGVGLVGGVGVVGKILSDSEAAALASPSGEVSDDEVVLSELVRKRG